MPKRNGKSTPRRSEIQMLRNEIGVYMEHIDERFDIVIEGQKGLRQSIDSLSQRMESVEKRLDRIEARVASIELRLDKLEIKVEGILREIREVKRELTELRHQKASKSQLHTLETRVVKLERQVA